MQIGEFMTIQQGANLYTQGFGSRPENVEVPHVENRAPTPYDVGGFFTVGKVWINPITDQVWILTHLITSNNITLANWLMLGSGGSGIMTLSGEGVNPLPPLANNFNFYGTPTGGPGAIDGAIQFTTVSNGQMSAQVRVDGTTVVINASNQLEANNAGIIWVIQTTDTVAVKNFGYFTNGANVHITLPPTSILGDTFKVYNYNGGGFTIVQGAGQTIQVGEAQTTVGPGGYVLYTQRGDAIELVCSVANIQWEAVTFDGNLTYN